MSYLERHGKFCGLHFVVYYCATCLVPFTFLPSVLAQDSSNEFVLLKRFRNEFVEIRPGTNDFPKEAIVHVWSDTGGTTAVDVKLEKAFQIHRYEMTQEVWQVITNSNPSRWKGPRNSVEMINYSEAKSFCQKITERLRTEKLIDANQVVRLPTEVEWEYAARAGTTSRYSFGDDESELGDFAWFTENAAGNDPPVGAKRPNAWGLYDVHGYLWEWCSTSISQDGTPVKESGCVLRSGSWKDSADKLTSQFVRRAAETLRDDAIGFRCVLDVE